MFLSSLDVKKFLIYIQIYNLKSFYILMIITILIFILIILVLLILKNNEKFQNFGNIFLINGIFK